MVFSRLPAAGSLQSFWGRDTTSYLQVRLGSAPLTPLPHTQTRSHTFAPSSLATSASEKGDFIVAWKHGFQGVAAWLCVSLKRFFSHVSLTAACVSALRRAGDLFPPQRHQVTEGVPGDTRAGRAERESQTTALSGRDKS